MGQHTRIITPNMAQLTARVKAGAALLDAHADGWRYRVNGEVLDCENGPELNCSHHGLLFQAFDCEDLHAICDRFGWESRADRGHAAHDALIANGFVYDPYTPFYRAESPVQAFFAHVAGLPVMPIDGEADAYLIADRRDEDEVLMEASALIELWRAELV